MLQAKEKVRAPAFGRSRPEPPLTAASAVRELYIPGAQAAGVAQEGQEEAVSGSRYRAFAMESACFMFQT